MPILMVLQSMAQQVLRISNVYVNSLDPSDIKVGVARDNGDSGTANTIFDDDAITTANGYQAAGNLNINGSATSGVLQF